MRTIVRLRRLAVVASAALLTAAAGSTAASAGEPEGTAFGNTCPEVQIIAVPGSNETHNDASPGDPVGAIASVAQSLADQVGVAVPVHYIGYPAHLGPLYPLSVNDGYEATWSTMNYYGSQCANTKFVVIGYSQGAQIAGDVAATIGHEGTPVSADRILSVRLLADPLRDPARPTVGITAPDILMHGSGIMGVRNDFGTLNDRVTSYCDNWDAVCNSNPVTAVALSAELWGSSAHTSYSTLSVSGTDQSFTQRIGADVAQDVVNPFGIEF